MNKKFGDSNYFSDSIFSLSKISPCSIASEIVLNFLSSIDDPTFSCAQANILGCNVIDTLTLLTFPTISMSAHKSAKKHINIVRMIAYKDLQTLTKDGDVMNERTGPYF